MISIAVPELLILLVIVVLVYGPERLGRRLRDLREALRRKGPPTDRRGTAPERKSSSR